MILGQDFQKKHKSVTIKFDGSKPELVISNQILVCALSEWSLGKPSLSEHLLTGCKPIVTKSLHFSKEDQVFIDQEIIRHLTEGIIEPCVSPWQSQIFVVKDPLQCHQKHSVWTTPRLLIRIRNSTLIHFLVLMIWSIVLQATKYFQHLI